jgi:hypothetical protein
MRVVYDCEVFPNVFTLAAEYVDSPFTESFEISPWRDDSKALFEWLMWLRDTDAQMVGFNNVGFDYPLIHLFMNMVGQASPEMIYAHAMAIIAAQDEDKFANIIWPGDRKIVQIDLFKIHHFDNFARATSLKALEFNMRLDNVADLPFPVGTVLNQNQITMLRRYNAHDVSATKAVYAETLPMIAFREELSAKYGKDFLNHNDVKIGKEIFQMALEASNVPCYVYNGNGRQPAQTPRPVIRLSECVPDYAYLHTRSFNNIKRHFENTTISETKGAFTDLTANLNGLEFVFGTGGLHASVENQSFIADEVMMILDVDVTSMYPSIAIANNYYPEHLTEKFIEVYQKLKDDRIRYKKGTAENAMLKLALNGVYGASNDRYSVFYDPRFTMQITITGQLSLAMLAEKLCDYGRIIQCNTDGITLYLPRLAEQTVRNECAVWEKLTGLELEYVEYSKMFVADVNSYLAEYVKGGVKRKGRYEYNIGWHQNASALVVPKVAEKVLLEGADPRHLVAEWPDIMDFMLRVKVPRTSKLVGIDEHGEHTLQNMTRYFVSTGGMRLVKVMPPLAKKPGVWRRIGVEAGRTVCVCNDIKDATLPIAHDYYLNEIHKLTLGMK